MKLVTLIRYGEFLKFNLCAQLPMWSDEDMLEVAAPLKGKIEVKDGILFTCWFKWDDYSTVREFYEGLGYEIVDYDSREEEKELIKVLHGH